MSAMATQTAPKLGGYQHASTGGKDRKIRTAYGQKLAQVQRENALLKDENRELKKLILVLLEENEHWQSVKHRIESLEKENQSLRAQVEAYKIMLYGPKSEKLEIPQPKGDEELLEDEHPSEMGRRPRGQKTGSAGHGRRIYSNIAEEIIVHELPQEKLVCPRCGKPYRELPKTERSQEIDYEVMVRLKVHKRKRYCKSCRCADVPAFITAPSPPKLIPRGILSVGMVSHIIVEKFGMGRPVSKTLELMSISSGLEISEGTVAGVMQKMPGLFKPLYQEIIERSKSARHWHADETGWKVYEQFKDKSGYNWWLWVFSSEEVVAFIIDPHRSRKVIKEHIGKGTGPPHRILSSDMFRIYNRLDGIVSSYCWAHMRRHFLKAMRGYRKALDAWGGEWLERIQRLYELNNERLKMDMDSPERKQAQARLYEHLLEMKQVRDEQINDPKLHEKGKEVLYMLIRYWEGLTVFLDHPEVPLDNNEAERMLRGPVVGRKNYYGSGSDWSGRLAAMVFSILATVEKNGLNPLTYMKAYLQSCADSGGKPPESIDSFLPWNMNQEERERLSAPAAHTA